MSTRKAFGRVIQREGRDGYYIRLRFAGQRVMRLAGETKIEADGALARIREYAMREKVSPIEAVDAILPVGERNLTGPALSFKSAVPEYLRYAKTRNRASTVEADAKRLDKAARTAWARKALDRISDRDLEKWFRNMEDLDGVSGSTLNRYRSNVSAVFSWAIRKGYASSNPARSPRIERHKEGPGREIYLTHEEAYALLRHCDDVLAPVVEVALRTGMRRGEILALSWGDVNLRRREITIRPESAKSGKGRVLRIGSRVWRLLGELRSEVPHAAADPVFLSARGVRLGGKAIEYRWPIARDAADLPETKRRLRFHDLRHTAASWLVAEGVPLYDVAKLLGHATIQMTMRYAHFAPEAGERAASVLDVDLEERATKRASTDSESAEIAQ